jgi:hypothetical protein
MDTTHKEYTLKQRQKHISYRKKPTLEKNVQRNSKKTKKKYFEKCAHKLEHILQEANKKKKYKTHNEHLYNNK